MIIQKNYRPIFPDCFLPSLTTLTFATQNFSMLSNIQVTGNKDTRSGFGDGILEAARKNPAIVALTADLAGSLKLNGFIKEFPERFIQCGISEANMIGVAAGLTIGGKIPYTTTFANFSTGRVYDQIRQSVAYSDKNVKICASHAGLTLGEDGATHQILEDIGLMKMLPGMTVIVPADYSQTKAATMAIADHHGPVYLRFGRPVWPIFTNEADFVLGKAQKLSDGADVSIFACGHLVWKAVEAGRILEEKGISVEVINIHTIKPLDTEAVIASIQKTKCAVTAEEHNIIGGLGDSIAQVAARNCPIPIEYVGTNDTFGESGKPTDLLKKYGLDTEFIVAAAEKVMARK
jgi:transketolase